MTPSNKDLIRMHLEEMLRETKQEPNWFYLISFCLGYYGEITQDHIRAVMDITEKY